MFKFEFEYHQTPTSLTDHDPALQTIKNYFADLKNSGGIFVSEKKSEKFETEADEQLKKAIILLESHISQTEEFDDYLEKLKKLDRVPIDAVSLEIFRATQELSSNDQALDFLKEQAVEALNLSNLSYGILMTSNENLTKYSAQGDHGVIFHSLMKYLKTVRKKFLG